MPQLASPCALVIAHPGHELRVFHWLETAQPLVFVLTDGSGHQGISRLGSTTRLLAGVGAAAGVLYGCMSDAELYRLLLAGDIGAFLGLAGALARALHKAGVRTVVGDALEGFNPGHDVCRLLIDAAVGKLATTNTPALGNFEFALVGSPQGMPEAAPPEALRLRLDDAALERKLAAARAYPEMAAEVAGALAKFGLEAFREETMWPSTAHADLVARFPAGAFFERHGEQRVREGHYRETVRLRDHLLPVAAALKAWAHG